MKKCLLPFCALVFFLACSRSPELEQTALPIATLSDLTTVYAAGDTTFRDARLMTIRQGEKMEYEMPHYASRALWEQRAAKLRQHILISSGLYPMPAKRPLNAKVYDKIEHDDYTIEKVYFESYPGFLVTGNLYRPMGKAGPFPGIITPHGHWSGRLENSEANSIPGRCINFAKQGYVVFSYDMVGYLDSKQVTHKFAADKEHELWAISLMGLQTWNSIRALDFLASLADVDTTRIACTGASGGGTQTFIITAIDPRIKVAAPVNMLSANFQGGCLCENAPGLRLDTFNIEIGALAAPRPLLMVATTQDWTKNTPTVEYPMMRSIYQLYGAENKLAYAQFDFPHNYNRSSREAVYGFFGKWLLGETDTTKLKEKPFSVDAPERMLNFPEGTRPPGDMNEEKLTAYLQQDARETLARYWPDSDFKWPAFDSLYGTMYKEVMAASRPAMIDVQGVGAAKGNGFIIKRLLLSCQGAGQWIPAVIFEPVRRKSAACLIVHPEGKSKLVNQEAQQPADLVQGLLAKGQSVLAIDVFKVGEHVIVPPSVMRDEKIKHFTTFNKTDTQERVQDILTALRYLRDFEKVNLLGIEEGGLWCMLAAALADDVNHVVADAVDLNLEDTATLVDKVFVPGLARVGGFSTALALAAPAKLDMLRAGKTGLAYDVDKAYTVAGRPRGIKKWDGMLRDAEIVRLLEK